MISAVRQTMGIMRPTRPNQWQMALTTRQMRRSTRYMTVFRHHLPHFTRVAKLRSSARMRPKATHRTNKPRKAYCMMAVYPFGTLNTILSPTTNIRNMSAKMTAAAYKSRGMRSIRFRRGSVSPFLCPAAQNRKSIQASISSRNTTPT